MQQYNLLFLAAIIACNVSFAQTAPEQIPVDGIQALPAAPQPGDKNFVQPVPHHRTPNVIDEATLRSDPQLLARLLDQAIMTRQFDAVAALLPLYEEVPHHDGQLVRYARAAVAQREGRLKDAIRLYRDMLAENGDLPPVRLQLAMALAADRQDGAAEDQLLRLRSEDLPPEIKQIIEQQLAQLQKRRSWSFNFSAYYQSDDNINNAPPQQKMAWGSGTLTFPEPIQARGIHYYVGADKTFPLNGGFYSGINGAINGDQWNKKDFNDLTISAGTTLGWRDTRRDIRINPFVRRRIFAGDAYSTSFGANLYGDYWVTPNLRLSANAQLGHTRHDRRTFLDGNQYYAGLNGLYVVSPERYFFGGVGFYRNATDDASDTYNRPSISLGWGQEWPYGLSSRLSATLSQRHYAGPDIFNIRRKDHEYNAKLSVWKRDWHFWDITPKLVIDWNRSDSNHFYYDGQQDSNVYIELSKTF